jgi:HK97 family phage major capsid protein
MADILKMSRAELESQVEATVRRLSTSGGTASENLNTRGSDDEVDQNAPRGIATRGTRSQFSERRTSLKREDAKNILSFFRGVSNKDSGHVERSLVALGMSQERLQQIGVSTDGGYTVPEQFVSEVLIDLPKLTPFADANLIRIVPMTTETLRWTKVVTRPANPPYVAEGSSYTKSGVKFGPITLVAKKIGEIIPFTEEIMKSNEIGMVQVISQLVADAFAFKYNSLVTNGNGDATEPEGVLTNAVIASTTWTATNDQTRSDSIIELYHGVQSQYRGEGIWLMHDSLIKLVRKLKDTQGRYMWTDGFAERPATLLGRPVYENPDMAATIILYGNFRRGYVLGMREGMTTDQNSSGSDWEKDIVNFKFRQRWDGRVHDTNAFAKATSVS